MSQYVSRENLRMRFSACGRTLPVETRFSVDNRVVVPDGNACENAMYAKCYKAPPGTESSRHQLDISIRTATVLIIIAFLVSGLRVLDCLKTRNQLDRKIAVLNQYADEIIKKNNTLALQISRARDEARVCYIASRELGMISADGIDIVYLHAPNTRPFESARLTMPQIGDSSALAKK